MKTFILNFLKGIIIGVANIIPGVSGGTIAVVLNVFDELIGAINNFFKDIKRYLVFLLPIILGVGFGIVAFSSLIEFSLSTYSFPTSTFFVGLVVGSIPLIYKKAASSKFKLGYAVPFVLALALVVSLSLIKESSPLAGDNASPNMLFLLVGGIIASAAMVVPGVSGSFIMILLGLYPKVIHAVSEIKAFISAPTDMQLLISILKVLAPLGIGVLLGIFIISKVISVLLEKAHAVTYFAILGLIFGSIFGIFNDPITYQSGVSAMSIGVGVVTFIVGTVISLFLGKE